MLSLTPFSEETPSAPLESGMEDIEQDLEGAKEMVMGEIETLKQRLIQFARQVLSHHADPAALAAQEYITKRKALQKHCEDLFGDQQLKEKGNTGKKKGKEEVEDHENDLDVQTNNNQDRRYTDLIYIPPNTTQAHKKRGIDRYSWFADPSLYVNSPHIAQQALEDLKKTHVSDYSNRAQKLVFSTIHSPEGLRFVILQQLKTLADARVEFLAEFEKFSGRKFTEKDILATAELKIVLIRQALLPKYLSVLFV
eukprot:CAMPEP_0201540022 /NCGR_PEP_ID=MMETSP0161_2-20130828/70720_1 /ASSEMBLY_ACC=CAM_ASM_000251 /TAXON_ID=180227 /ORGANISM="Neoparamoeba aestuarina, Strain SoJaBio B1-5/56/2" /LENGTH=252 /DNA_ID=CAMNT_0047947461 /DNA_START=1457 /DNA_END=2216 /DNA_ORIENTATION=+